MPTNPVRIVDAWNGWYHVNGNTYGTWIRGDERGWRARHHREHVEGDYKNPPPPDAHRAVRAFSHAAMDEPVRLSPAARARACAVMVESLRIDCAEPIACAIDDHHYHIIARFRLPTGAVRLARMPRTRHQPIYALIREIVGRAKSRAARALSREGLAAEGGVWAKRCKITPIADRSHQVTAFRYIAAHARRGASAWTLPRDRASAGSSSD